ncbi:putative ABC transport system ATP-binding protein [Pseudonocardia thermophila]|jgi:ABC-type antimicrobial peptide transport system, ATPase component|uniref:Putative ABC transport system ATP-binding protein n=1 Tax=Pseudonocardia thermophila TaxID=1848 RepID=A0A1M6R228_PSETH|nr:ABC transporter ATP-binding protein [Pseudonocardia thermophila]SHK26407.1 putative ABC transport system ATP-binding protein [Pseudonocardia thermophila]
MIELEAVSKVYRTGAIELRALDDINLTIEDGDLVAIMGASGSGKSTMMNILGCLDAPTSGTYRLDGIDVGKLRENALADIRNKKIGFVFQSFNLIPRTSAIRNVELPMVYGGGRNRRERARRALERVGLGDRLNHMPNELSGGQQQRVAVARALVMDPTMILADEPTGNLDTASTIDIMNLFVELNDAGRTVVLITHEPEVAEFAKRVVTLRDGHIISDVRQEQNREHVVPPDGRTERFARIDPAGPAGPDDATGPVLHKDGGR